VPKFPVGEETEINQLAHTYLPRKEDPNVGESYTSFFKRRQLQLSLLRKFNLPYFYYSVTVNHVVFFFLNTNNYAQHYYNWMTQKNMDPLLNQRIWFKNAYDRARAANKTIVVCQHQPLIVTDKRAAFGDAYLYLDYPASPISNQVKAWDTLAETFQLDKNKYLYSDLLLKMFEADDIQPDMIACAHSHGLGYYNNKLKTTESYKICQVISGGGGSRSLFDQKDMSKEDIKGCQEQKYGFFKMTFHKLQPKLINIECHTTDGLNLTFTNADHKPVPVSSLRLVNPF
jgi:hypothetical protein